jgi:arabinan endo-1,5-alpha-L-arabinosidase
MLMTHLAFTLFWQWFCLFQFPDRQNTEKVKTETYTNPVFEPILADPTVIYDSITGYFYAYGTQDNWGDGQGTRIVPVLRSSDLVSWEIRGEAFDQKPSWKSAGGIWAPNVQFIDGKYVMYYSFSTWGDANPGIGVAVAEHPEGPFIDQGKLFTSEEIGVPNSIDPHFYEENGRRFLFWGSYSQAENQGTYVIPLRADGFKVEDAKAKTKIAAGDIEAVMIHFRKGYYYFFGSKENCCEGANSKYHVVMGRSKNLLGPYLDQQGKPLTERGSGTIFLKGNDHFVGPGHNAQLITDDAGMDWILYHGIDPAQGKVASGATRRMLMLDQVRWKEGWPYINNQSPSWTPQAKPVFY